MSKTNGAVGAIFYGDSQLGPEDKYSNQINSGTLDMMMTVSDWTPIVPEVGVLTIGFLFDSLDQTGKVMDGRAGQLLGNLFKQKTKAEVLGWCYNFGGRSVLTKKPITTAAEFHGLKLRVLPSPTYVETFRLLGADPVPMSFNEVYRTRRKPRGCARRSPFIRCVIPSQPICLKTARFTLRSGHRSRSGLR